MPDRLFVTEEEWRDHVIRDHPPRWQCPCCNDDPPIFTSLSGFVVHVSSDHSEKVDHDLEALICGSQISMMGLKKCPLCEFEGPQDSPHLIDHILQHIHDFSLHALPWPMDHDTTQLRPAGLFDLRHEIRYVTDGQENQIGLHIGDWAESVAPKFDQSRQKIIVIGPNEEELILETPSLHGEVFLQLRTKEHSITIGDTEGNRRLEEEQSLNLDYFAHYPYFADDSSSASTQQAQSQRISIEQQDQNDQNEESFTEDQGGSDPEDRHVLTWGSPKRSAVTPVNQVAFKELAIFGGKSTTPRQLHTRRNTFDLARTN
jgi:hypothetical protein